MMDIVNKDAAHESKAFEFRARVSLAFHQQIQRSFVSLTSNYDPDNSKSSLQYVLEQSKQHRVILRQLIVELNLIASEFGENFEGAILGDLVVQDELDRLDMLDVQLTTIHDNWQLLEAVTFSSPRVLSVNFVLWLQSVCAPFSPLPSLPSTTSNAKLERSSVYWQLLLQLTLRGHFHTAHDLLCRHSEIALLLQTEPHSIAEQSVSQILGGVSRSDCVALLRLFETHPYAGLLHTDNSNNVDNNSYGRLESLSAAQLSQEFVQYQESVQALRHSGATLLSRNPALDQVLRVLQGEKSVLLHEASGSNHAANNNNNNGWLMLLLGQLLHCHSPGLLSRHSLCDLLDTCVTTFNSSINNNNNNTATTTAAGLMLTRTRDVLQGRLVSLLSLLHSTHVQLLPFSYYNRNNSNVNSSKNSVYNMLGELGSASLLQSLTHLSLLILDSQIHPELGRALPTHDDGFSLVQELSVQTAQQLNALDFSPKMVIFYLRHLPAQHAAAFVDVLLPRRHYVTDTLALQAHDLLAVLGRSDAARELLALHSARHTATHLLCYTHNNNGTRSYSAYGTSFRKMHVQKSCGLVPLFAQRLEKRRLQAVSSLPPTITSNNNSRNNNSNMSATNSTNNHSNMSKKARVARLLAEACRDTALHRLVTLCLADVATAFTHCAPLCTLVSAGGNNDNTSNCYANTSNGISNTAHKMTIVLSIPATVNHLSDLHYTTTSASASTSTSADKSVSVTDQTALWTLLEVVKEAEDVVDALLLPLQLQLEDGSRTMLRKAVVALDAYAKLIRHLLDFHLDLASHHHNSSSSNSTAAMDNSRTNAAENTDAKADHAHTAVFCDSRPLRHAAETAASLAWLLRPSVTTSSSTKYNNNNSNSNNSHAMDVNDSNDDTDDDNSSSDNDHSGNTTNNYDTNIYDNDLYEDGDDTCVATQCLANSLSLHCVELACVLHACVATHETQQSRDISFLRHLETQLLSSASTISNSNNNSHSSVKVSDLLPLNWCGATLSVTQAKRLCKLVHLHTTLLYKNSDDNDNTADVCNVLLQQLGLRCEGVYVTAAQTHALQAIHQRHLHLNLEYPDNLRSGNSTTSNSIIPDNSSNKESVLAQLSRYKQLRLSVTQQPSAAANMDET